MAWSEYDKCMDKAESIKDIIGCIDTVCERLNLTKNKEG